MRFANAREYFDGVAPERKDRVMDPDHAQTLQRDALQHTKDYGLFVLRTCILLNGGAIIALLTAVTHQSNSIIIALGIIRFSIVLLVFGLVCAVVAAVFGYLNFERGQRPFERCENEALSGHRIGMRDVIAGLFLRGGNHRSFFCERSANFRNRWADRKMKTKNTLTRPEATPLAWHHLDHCLRFPRAENVAGRA